MEQVSNVHPNLNDFWAKKALGRYNFKNGYLISTTDAAAAFLVADECNAIACIEAPECFIVVTEADVSLLQEACDVRNIRFEQIKGKQSQGKRFDNQNPNFKPSSYAPRAQ